MFILNKKLHLKKLIKKIYLNNNLAFTISDDSYLNDEICFE